MATMVLATIITRSEPLAAPATSIDDKSVHFAPRENADNSFSWEKESSDLWLARLRMPDPQGKQNEKVYRMDRIKH